jgi:hypothetical protein
MRGLTRPVLVNGHPAMAQSGVISIETRQIA